MKPDKLVFDKNSVRTMDQNGHLHVEVSNISAARVNPYLGSEIPGWRQLGLDANRIYQMLRHPDELKKAADSFNGVPLLDNHTPVSADDHPYSEVVGATGTDAEFDGTYLKNSLVVWTSDAIERIENGKQREISCSYSYTPDMTPGVFDGVAYQGVMRNIKANHVALVPSGRAGADVLVSDSTNHRLEVIMKKKYSLASLMELAKDKKVDTLTDLMDLLAKDEAEEKKEDKKAEDEETDEEKAARLKKEAESKKAEDEESEELEKKEKAEEKKANDAAIQKAKDEVKAEMRDLHAAEEFVAPWVGKLAAMDSAEAVYKAALDLKGIKHEGVHPSALRSICEAHMTAAPAVAMDSKIKNDFAARFPNGAKIKRA